MSDIQPTSHGPLSGLRIVELSDKTEMCARFLADLGAEVIVVEPPAGCAARHVAPFVNGVSLYGLTHHANKRSVVLDLQSSEDRARFDRLLGTADLFIETTRPGTLDALGLGVPQLRAAHPALLVLSITDFGQTGPYRDFVADNAVHTAMSGVLARSGLPQMPPLLPPGSLAWEAAAVQAAWVALLALWQRTQTGLGDHLDFSLYEAVAQVLDPALGVTGSALAGASALDTTPPGRPVPMPLYPVIPCADGLVRLCVLNPRQWQAMSAWLGTDHPFTDPAYGNIAKRMGASAAINASITTLFKAYSASALVEEGRRRGIPLAIMATPSQVLADAHFNARGAFADVEVAPGVRGRVPTGYLEIDGRRAGLRQPMPALGADTEAVFSTLEAVLRPTAATPPDAPAGRPLAGLRVLDLGVIVAGAEGGRLFADQGAEVIKIEHSAFPDGLRQSMTGDRMTPSIAQGLRNKLSMGINLRSAQGVALFKQLVSRSDVLLSNFKPGTLESLGIGPDVLLTVNPRLVMMDSSALGNTGPQSRTLGYGPLVRASTGLSCLWSYPGVPHSFSDGTTVYPDHLAARVAGVGVLAALVGRLRSGRGGTVSLSQAEVFLVGNAEHFLRESLEPGSFVPRGNSAEFQAPSGVYRCAGEDEWCVVSVRTDAEWTRFAPAIGRPDLLDDAGLSTCAGRVSRRAELDALVSQWTAQHPPKEVTRLLQAASVPAGFMQRLTEYRTDPQFTARDFIAVMHHPHIPLPLPTENRVVRSSRMLDPALNAAPFQGQHTRSLAAQLLALDAETIDALVAAGDLEDIDARDRAALAAAPSPGVSSVAAP